MLIFYRRIKALHIHTVKPGLKQKIFRYLTGITLIAMLLVLVAVTVVQVILNFNKTHEDASKMFTQVNHLLDENQAELNTVMTEYSDACLLNASSIAYIIQYHPEVVTEENITELQKIADLIGVDEIHIFDTEGTIIFGTQPEYYGYSFDSGDQIGFFKPMLTDHSLKLVQEITPNTAEGKLVQYSAVWSEDDRYIIQIGMYPEAVINVQKKNELSYIFSLLRVNSGISLYAIDKETGKILGCTDNRNTDLIKTELGFTDKEIVSGKGFIANIQGVRSYVIIDDSGKNYIAYVVPYYEMFENVLPISALIGIGLLFIGLVIVLAILRYTQKYIIKEINSTNEGLREIADGNLNTKIAVTSSQEFEELSDHINSMVHSLVNVQRQIELERDMDMLTGLLNRTGLNHALANLKRSEDAKGYCAVVLADSDSLKTVNDEYGHKAGDTYIRATANLLKQFKTKASICSRQGGDEFVLIAYGYDDEEALSADLKGLCALQSGSYIKVGNDEQVEVRFSVGYTIVPFNKDFNYEKAFKEADKKMYLDKNQRKGIV